MFAAFQVKGGLGPPPSGDLSKGDGAEIRALQEARSLWVRHGGYVLFEVRLPLFTAEIKILLPDFLGEGLYLKLLPETSPAA